MTTDTKTNFSGSKLLIKQPTVQLFQTNTTISYSDNSFNVKPTKILSDCGGRGLRPDPPSPTDVNLIPGRDVIRGQCLVDNCDCEEFDLDESLSFVVTAVMHLQSTNVLAKE